MAATGEHDWARDSATGQFTGHERIDYGNGTSSDESRGGGEERRAADVSGWNDRTPTGRRGGVDEDEAARLAHRSRQEQRVHEADLFVRKFTHTQFVAHMTDRVTFNRNGDMMITIQVPYQFKHLAQPLTDAFGIPLSWDVEIWAPYSDAVDGQATG